MPLNKSTEPYQSEEVYFIYFYSIVFIFLVWLQTEIVSIYIYIYQMQQKSKLVLHIFILLKWTRNKTLSYLISTVVNIKFEL